jgi:hypothetical protein
MVRLGMLWFKRKDLLVQRFCFPKTARAVVGNGFLEERVQSSRVRPWWTGV